jgi:hypothetical protein
MTKTHREQLEALAEIRSIMERSSRFISLSGLSGVAAGLWALLGAAAAFAYLGIQPFAEPRYYYLVEGSGRWGLSPTAFFLLDGALVLLLALGSGIYFTTRKARRRGLPIWDALTRRLLWNLAIPLAAGGLFCLAMLRMGSIGLVAPATLVFYGLALINASKYTLPDIRYLGLTEVGLGVVAAFLPGHGLEVWAVGFGLLHILYGGAMYFKYERN